MGKVKFITFMKLGFLFTFNYLKFLLMHHFFLKQTFRKLNSFSFCLIISITVAVLTGCQQVLERFEADLKGAKQILEGDTFEAFKAVSEANKQEASRKSFNTPDVETVMAPTANKRLISEMISRQQIVAIPLPSEEKPQTQTVTPSVTASKFNQTKKPPTTASDWALTNQIQTIDEDGNPLEASTKAQKFKPRVIFED
jgi:hypothetical protein